MLELYHYWDSVCSTKVRMCLAEKGLEWTGHHVDILAFEQTHPDYLALNPNAVVPTLVHDGRPVIESTVINEYLDEVFPAAPLAPRDPYGRARMRAWVMYEDHLVYPQVKVASFNLMLRNILTGRTDAELKAMTRTHPNPRQAALYRRAARSAPKLKEVAAAAATLVEAVRRFEAALSQHPWLAGRDFTLADIAMAPMMDRLEHLDMANLWAGAPATADWIARLKERPSYGAAMPAAEHRVPGPLSAR